MDYKTKDFNHVIVVCHFRAHVVGNESGRRQYTENTALPLL